MKTWLALIHLAVTCLFLGLIFGISFGLINPSVNEYKRYQETTCYMLDYTNITYNHYYQLCNTSIPSCSNILQMNVTGRCYNDLNDINDTNEDMIKYIQCFITSDIYTILNITFQYPIINSEPLIQNIQYDCENNQTCIQNVPNFITCYYEINNPYNVFLNTPQNYRWEYIAAIVILCFLMLFYVLINLTVFKKYNYFCGKEW